MTPLILYYSRSGNTRMLAHALAKALDTRATEICCDRYDGGTLSYLRAGYDSLRGNFPAITVPAEARQPRSHVLIGCPIWTSHPATPLRRYLADYGGLHKRTAFFLTYGGHSPPVTTVTEMSALVMQPANAALAVNSTTQEETTVTQAIQKFLADLNTEWPNLLS